MNQTEQKMREFAADILNWADPHNSKHQQNLDGAVQIYKKHFGQPEQPDKSLEEIVKNWFPKHKGAQYLCTQACIEYAATKGAK